jgi:hypothetical protein
MDTIIHDDSDIDVLIHEIIDSSNRIDITFAATYFYALP